MEINKTNEILQWIQQLLGNDIGELKPRDEFDNEEAYLMYLVSNPKAGRRTKKAAEDMLKKRYSDGLYSLWKKQCSKQYIAKYRYKYMQQIHCKNNNEFSADVQYRVVNEQNKVVLKDKRTLICTFDNKSPTTETVNPFYGLEYRDLSREVCEQILLNKLKELIQVNLKIQKWSNWNEAIVIIDEEE